MRAMPAAFQNSAVASSATPTKAPPIASARAPTPIFRNCPSNVPTFSKILAASETPGTSRPASPSAHAVLFTLDPSFGPMLADHHETTALGALLGLDGEQVDPAHDVLAVARNQIPAGLAVVRIVLLPVVPRSRDASRIRDRGAHRIVHRVVGVQLGHEVARHRVDPDRPPV